jgi:hypothetical protein
MISHNCLHCFVEATLPSGFVKWLQVAVGKRADQPRPRP